MEESGNNIGTAADEIEVDDNEKGKHLDENSKRTVGLV